MSFTALGITSVDSPVRGAGEALTIHASVPWASRWDVVIWTVSAHSVDCADTAGAISSLCDELPETDTISSMACCA